MRILHSRLLRYLDEVARTGSIRKASDRLNIASSSINRQILALEAEIGTPIFDRLHRRLRLTTTGEVLIAHVRRTLKDMAQAEAQIEEIKGFRRGEVSVALVGGLASSFLSHIGATFRERYPRVKLRFRRLDGDKTAEAVINGECDLALSFWLPDDPGLRVISSVDCHFGAVVSADHPLAKRSSVRMSDCVDFPMVLPDQTMVVRQKLDTVFQRMGVQPSPLMESNSIEMIRGFVASGQGLSFLNQINVHDERLQGTIRFLPIIDRCPPVTLKIASRAAGHPQLMPGLLADAIRAGLEELEPGAPTAQPSGVIRHDRDVGRDHLPPVFTLDPGLGLAADAR
jgi:DNA-binding transcriptional LysR family regulator